MQFILYNVDVAYVTVERAIIFATYQNEKIALLPALSLIGPTKFYVVSLQLLYFTFPCHFFLPHVKAYLMSLCVALNSI